MYEPMIDMIELWPERTCGAQDTFNMMCNICGPSIRTNALACAEKYIADYVEKYIS